MTCLWVGHRGVAGLRPENTWSSIRHAVDSGLTWVEVDVQPTRDGHLVICHDHELERCSNGHGRVDQQTLAQLEQLDFGSWFDSRYQSESIVTLPALLAYAKENNLSLNLEVKVDIHQPEQVLPQLLADIDASGIDRSQLLLTSFSHTMFIAMMQMPFACRIGLLTEDLTADDMALLKQYQPFSCHLNHRTLTLAQVKALKSLGLQIWVYTVNDPQAFTLLPHVDAIFSDYLPTA
uniref:glycerophosphodiester phosphodiesterase family protein n=1 Tax=Thaumasiovibrio occultus TaxID=1891184 RepID=UPI000B34D73A|nr:glycerophosphodiester phosphodiesterase family protein [Thaumasiovibrio occultus]